jgi:radical SAM-linked protein
MNKCTDRCGICPGEAEIVENSIHVEKKITDETMVQRGSPEPVHPAVPGKKDPATLRMLFSFSKSGKGVFISHLGTVELFSMALVRSGLPVQYTQGFNPLASLEFASPVSLGISCDEEIAAVDLLEPVDPGDFLSGIQNRLPEGFTLLHAECFLIPSGAKKHSLSSLLWGFRYGDEPVCAKEEKAYRSTLGNSNYGLRRTKTLAKSPGNLNQGDDYFTIYRALYR